MASRKQVTWAELRVGLFVLVTLTLLAVFVFYVTGGGNIFAERISYITYLPDVAGLSTGAPVRLAGFAVGSVDRVSLADFGEDRSRRAKVEFQISKEYERYVRSGSLAFITTEGLLGESVLEIDPSLTGEVLPAGGTVPGAQKGNIKQIVQNVDQITGDVRTLIGDLRAGKGTLGALFVDPSIYNQARDTVAKAQSLVNRAAEGEGTIGRLLVSEDIYDRMKSTVENAEQIVADVKDGKGNLGAFLYDRTIYEKAESVVTRADNVMAKVEAGEGTLGKLIHDDALHNDIQNTFQNVADITRKVNEGEGTFGRALNDTRLYENINNFTSEMRGLLSDFRKNPKKYLRIKFSLF